MNTSKSAVRKPRPASTVILVREADEKIQIYLIRRSRKSAFMPGNYVFPGGNLEPDDWDFEFWTKQIDLDSKEIEQRLGGGLRVETAVAYGIAAIRETFEEAGILMVKEGQHDRRLSGIQERRMNNKLKPGWFMEWVKSEKVMLSLSELKRWSYWITPKARSHRYDTRFFLTFTPEGQVCIPDNREMTHGLWVGPEEGLTGNQRGETPLSPPALVTLHELLSFGRSEDLKKEIKNRPWGRPRLSILKRFSEGELILLPGDPDYGKESELEPGIISKERISPGKTFTRLWCQDGIWSPVEV